jgi:hypothetical protein
MTAMHRAVTAAMALALAIGTAGAARAATLAFGNILEGTVQLAIDGQPVTSLECRTIIHVPLAPGPHTIQITTADGARAQKDVTLNEDEAADAKGQRWWCGGVGLPNGSTNPIIISLPTADCKAFIEEGS